MDVTKLVAALSDNELLELADVVWQEKEKRFNIDQYPTISSLEEELLLTDSKIKAIICYKFRTKLPTYVCKMVIEKYFYKGEVSREEGK